MKNERERGLSWKIAIRQFRFNLIFNRLKLISQENFLHLFSLVQQHQQFS